MKKNTYTLGISALYHDSAACLLLNGEIIAAAAEERFSRIKHDENFPKEAIKFCLHQAKIKLEDIDSVTFYEKPFVTFERLIDTYLNKAPKGFASFRVSSPIWLKNKIFIKAKINDSLQSLADCEKDQIPKLLFSPHHYSHAASAFYPSPFSKAAILCVDGVGEYASTSIWTGDGNKIELIKQINFPDSIGLLYSAFTYYCGFKVNDGEYKLMGLAPYGKPLYADLIKDNLVKTYPDGSFKVNQKYFSYQTGLKMTNKKFDKLFNGAFREPGSSINQKTLDIAASIQSVTEDLLLNLIRHVKEVTKSDYLCLAGGVALNCVANGKILKSNLYKDIWIQPAASDAGGSIGASYAAYYLDDSNERLNSEIDKMKSCHLGPEYDEKEIESFLLSKNTVFEKVTSTKQLIEKTTALILSDKVIGWFQGRSEFGPRALGNRSILGNAMSSNLQKEINLKIKNRESFRPFAPVILEEDVSSVFTDVRRSPYMLLVDKFLPKHQITKEKETLEGLKKIDNIDSTFPAVTHVNNTGRIQTVTLDANPLLYNLLLNIKNKIGVGIAINTSFNVSDEPIVNSPEDAYNCFMNTNMDTLVIGNFILNKENQRPLARVSVEKILTSKKEILTFWAKTYLFIIVLSYITLPLLGYDRSVFPALIGLVPIIISIFFTKKIRACTDHSLQLTTILKELINSLLLAIVYFLIITPYALILRPFIKDKRDCEGSNWSKKDNLKINENLF
jgi:carbamoyltransferase